MAVDVILIPILGFFIGIIASMLGIGGGVFVVPVLQLLPLGVDFYPTLAAGTSLTMISFKALSSTYGYAKQRRIDYKVGLLLAITAIPGSFAGAFLTDVTARIGAHELLQLTFATFLIFIATRMIFPYRSAPNLRLKNRSSTWKRKLQDSFGNQFEYSVDLKTGMLLGFFAGVSSGLLGIGGVLSWFQSYILLYLSPCTWLLQLQFLSWFSLQYLE